MAISGARIPVSNTYARALAPSINLPSATLTGMPEPVGLLQGSIPQIVPTQGMLNYTPTVIDESGWNLPSSSFDVTQYVKDYWAKKNNTNNGDNGNGENSTDTMSGTIFGQSYSNTREYHRLLRTNNQAMQLIRGGHTTRGIGDLMRDPVWVRDEYNRLGGTDVSVGSRSAGGNTR